MVAVGGSNSGMGVEDIGIEVWRGTIFLPASEFGEDDIGMEVWRGVNPLPEKSTKSRRDDTFMALLSADATEAENRPTFWCNGCNGCDGTWHSEMTFWILCFINLLIYSSFTPFNSLAIYCPNKSSAVESFLVAREPTFSNAETVCFSKAISSASTFCFFVDFVFKFGSGRSVDVFATSATISPSSSSSFKNPSMIPPGCSIIDCL